MKTETATAGSKQFLHSYSDSGFYIKRDGVKYTDATDPLNSRRSYTETAEEIEAAADMS